MTFLMYGTLWFWIVIVAAFICIIVATEKESGLGSTTTMLITIALFFMFGNKVHISNLFSYCSSHVLIFIGAIVGYLILGTGWAILKWYSFILKQLDRMRRGESFEVPKVKDHKQGIMAWMLYWPWSLIWTIIDVPVKRAYLFIYNLIASRLQRMSDNIFCPLRDEMEEHKHHRIDGKQND